MSLAGQPTYRPTVLPPYRLAAFILLALTWIVPHLRAQDVEPRAMTPAPVGTNFIGLAAGYSAGAILLDKTIPVENLDGTIYSLAPSYNRYVNLFGLTGRFTAVVPIATGDWKAKQVTSATDTSVTRTGLGDAVLNTSIFFVGAPAMTPAEFRNYRRKTVVAFNLRLSVPTGQYSANQLINLGSNRWQVGVAGAVSQWLGKWTLEAYATAWFFTDNTNGFGGNTLSQDPLYAFQAHVAYTFKPGLWLSFGARQTAGGKTSVNGVKGDTPTELTRLGLVLGIPVGRRNTLRVTGTEGVRNTTGNDFNTVVVQWVYRF